MLKKGRQLCVVEFIPFHLFQFVFLISSNLKSIDNIRSSFQNIETYNHDQTHQIHDTANNQQKAAGVTQPTARYAFLDLPTAAQTNNSNFMFNSMSSLQQQQQPDYFSNIQTTNKDIPKTSALCSAIKSEIDENGSILNKNKAQEAIASV